MEVRLQISSAQSPEGKIVTHKLLSENPEQYKDAALQGIRLLLGLNSHDPIPSDKINVIKNGHHSCH